MNPTFAELLLQEYGVSQPEDIDLEAIAFDQGATIKFRRLDSCEARIIGHGTTAVISINNTSHPDRQRFSLARVFGTVFPELADALWKGDSSAPKELTRAYMDEVREATLILLYRLFDAEHPR